MTSRRRRAPRTETGIRCAPFLPRERATFAWRSCRPSCDARSGPSRASRRRVPCRTTKSSVRRVGLRAAVAILSLFALYPIAMNVFLSTSLFERTINATPESILVQYERAWSLFPTRIHTKNLWIRGKDSQVEWVLRLDACTFDVSVFELLAKKRFHVTRVAAEGITFRLRRRIPSPEATTEYVAALPPIPGFGRIPIRPPDAPDALERWNDDHWNLWTIHLEHVDARSVHEIWVDNLRVEGESRLIGSFYLKPLREVRVGPVDVQTSDTRVSLGERLMLEHGKGTGRVAIAPLDPRVIDPPPLVHRIDLETDLRGRVPHIESFTRTMTRPIELGGPVENAELALRIKSGVIDEGTRLKLSMAPFAAWNEHRFTGVLDVEADVERVASGSSRMTFDAHAHELTLTRRSDAHAVLRGADVTITGESTALDLVDPFADLHVAIVTPGVDIPDVRALADYVSHAPAVIVSGGRARAAGRFELWRAERRAKASLEVEADRLGLSRGDVDCTSGVMARVTFHDWDWERGDLALDDAYVELGRLRANARGGSRGVAIERAILRAKSPRFVPADPLARVDVSLAVEGASVEDAAPINALLTRSSNIELDASNGAFDAALRASIERHVGHGTVVVHALGVGARGRAVSVTGNVDLMADIGAWHIEDNRLNVTASRVRIDDLETRFDGHEKPDAVAKHIELRAQLHDVDTRSPSLRGGDFSVSAAGVRVDDAKSFNTFLPNDMQLAIASGRAEASLDLEISSSRKAASGKILVALRNGGIRFQDAHLVGDFDVDTRIGGFDPDRQTLDLRGSRIALRNVRTLAEAEVPSWHGEVDALQADLRLGDARGIDAFVRLHSQDASPILELALQDSLPRSLLDFLRAPDLAGQARLTVDRQRFAIRDAHVRGGETTVRGSYAFADDHRHGACLIANGPFAVGVSVDDHGTYLRFWKLETWLRDHNRVADTLYEAAERVKAKAPPK